MPSFRDLRGKPVEEVVTSRLSGPGVPDGPDPVERAAVQKAMAAIAARKPRPLDLVEDRDDPEGEEAREQALADARTPEDFEAILSALAQSVTDLHIAVTDSTRLMHEQIRALRARAEADLDKLAKVRDALKHLAD